MKFDLELTELTSLNRHLRSGRQQQNRSHTVVDLSQVVEAKALSNHYRQVSK
jgi:hypothetical protein